MTFGLTKEPKKFSFSLSLSLPSSPDGFSALSGSYNRHQSSLCNGFMTGNQPA